MNLVSIHTKDIVLASQAPWRSDILSQLGISHRQINHCYQEPKFSTGSIEAFIETIAREKARSLVDQFPDSIIIAADQVICLGDRVLYKSGTREKAVEQLHMLNGKTHRLICAVAVYGDGVIDSEVDTAELQMRMLQSSEIEYYVDSDKPWDCAGSYKIESLGASLFEKIVVNDPTTIIGIPSHKLLDLLRNKGFSNLF